MNIAIVGCGFVGGTVANFLEANGINVLRVDPKYYELTLTDAVAEADGVIMCLPTPCSDDGTCDADLVWRNVDKILEIRPDISILLKSTVPPDVLERLDVTVVYNPEFLRERFAEQDFVDQKQFILGAEPEGDIEFWQNLFQPLLPNCVFHITDRNTASMIKYVHNSWLATKVAFFHELAMINDWMERSKQFDYKMLTNILGEFPNIGNTHMTVPNTSGTFGYGGACFPKDVSALLEYYKKEHFQLSILDKVHNTNKDILNEEIADMITTRFPEEPFMLCLGTSHTFGECNGERNKTTFNTHIAQSLGLKEVNVGLSGAVSKDFIQIVNELQQYDGFNENCKLVLFEARVTDNNWEIDTESVTSFDSVKYAIERDNMRNKQLLHRTALGPENVMNGNKIDYNESLNEYLKVNGQVFNLNYDFVEMLLSNLTMNQNQEDVVKEMDKADINKAIENAEYQTAFQNKNVATAFKDIQNIDIIKNYVQAKNIPFAWILVDSRVKYLSECKFLLDGKTDLFDYMLLGTDVKDVLNGLLSAEGKTVKDVECDCGHLNQEGNKLAADILLPEVEKVLNGNKRSNN